MKGARREPVAPAPPPATRWAAYWYGDVEPARPFLLSRVVLLLLSFDVWVLLLSRASRYGFGGFNVSHFAWLDAIQPLPTVGLYSGVLVLSGMLAFVAAFTGDRLTMAALAAVYTYGWAMSLLDGYQHHYLLSLILLSFALLPSLSARALDKRVSAWSFRLLSATFAIVYLFAAASKYERGWRAGGPLELLAETRPPFVALRHLAASLGISRPLFWTLASLGVTATEVLVATGYLLATRDDTPSAWRRRLRWAAWIGALTIHIEATFLRLEIGWFSAYMLIASSAFFLPATWLRRVGGVAARTLGDSKKWNRPLATWIAAGLGAGGWIACGLTLDLPGALGASLIAAAAIGVAGGLAVRRRRFLVGVRYGLAGAAAALACTIAVSVASVRFDFYRFLGGDYERHKDVPAALDAFEKAQQYAPSGRSLRPKIDELLDEM